ncbi:DUF3094 domain-containing protein [Microbulbifer sp. CAU 1566]|uniref:DUF3094 family protein n=1 Tax=Microbulbifer sp. CAU 1566 TaxID=2933269 RepID=UPI002002B95D|nr:DUF3094 family protein [Microbulbifer sp. CAU 1566]MCK7598911.1 DUF3094 domain-containing protein [Microbulbifer sp. CAU 1566]
MSNPESESEFTVPPKKLSAEDQAKVDRYLQRGHNDVDRKPFRPLLLLGIILAVLTLLSLLSLFIARSKGVV